MNEFQRIREMEQAQQLGRNISAILEYMKDVKKQLIELKKEIKSLKKIVNKKK